MKKVLTLAMTALIAGSSLLAFTSDADAQRRRHHYRGPSGGAIATGAILGIAAGAIAAGAARSEPRYYYVDDERPRRCWIKKVRVWDEWEERYVIERRRVCR